MIPRPYDTCFCMGRRENYARCLACLRLPRTPEDEEATDWLDPAKRTIPRDAIMERPR